jgi:glycerophosphoryl diester phosphodiesterase/predicted Fe-S protein YdhL (DUF1289 family)
MDIEIPPWLEWVSYLAGSTWPHGSETGMFRIKDYYHATAGELEGLVPELNSVREETLSVLFGDLADAADEQFAMLFDGDYAMNKLADAVRALGDSAGSTGSEIEYTKLSVYVGLALAAAEISYALAMSGPTGGVSLGWIPITEMLTMAGFRRLVSLGMNRIFGMMRTTLGRTMVRQLLRDAARTAAPRTFMQTVRHEVMQEARQELAMAGLQEGIIYGIQGDRSNMTGERLFVTGIASTVGGGAGGGTAVPVSRALGPATTKLGRAGKGMTTFFTAGIAGNIAGTASVGGQFDPLMIVASSTTSSVGGARGAGVQQAHGGNTSSDPPGEDSRTVGERTPDGPLNEDSAQADSSDETSPVKDSSNNGHEPNSVDSARVAAADNHQSAPDTSGHVNDVASQNDPSTSAPSPTNDHQSVANDGAAQTDQPSTHAGETNDTPRQSPEGATLTGADTNGDQSGHDPAQGLPVADNTADPSQSGLPLDPDVPSDSHTPGPETDPESVVAEPEPDHEGTTPAIADGEAQTATPPPAHPGSQSPAAPAAAASSVGPAAVSNARPPTSSTPSTTSSSTPAASAPKSDTSTPAPATPEPKPTGRQDVPESAKAAASGSDVAASAPAARISDKIVIPAPRNTNQADSEQPVQRPDAGHDGPGRTERTDCLDRLAEKLSIMLGRKIQLADFASPRGRPPVELFQALGAGSEFATYDDVRRVLGTMEKGAFAVLVSAWDSRGGHAYLAIHEGDGRVRIEDSFTGEPIHWSESEVLRTAAGFLHADGRAREPLRDIRQLVAAAAIGDVQGPPLDEGGSPDAHDRSGDGSRGVVPDHMVAEEALQRRGLKPDQVDEIRHPMGLMEAGCERSRDNVAWWDSLTSAEQDALINTFPHQIGNAEGIPAEIRHDANTLAMEQDRTKLQHQASREGLTRNERKQLARLEQVHQALAKAGEMAKSAGVKGPLLLAFESEAFGGSGRAMVSFGSDPTSTGIADPYKAESVAWHVPGRGMDVDQIGPVMGDALNQLRSTLHEKPGLRASSIAWIGYNPASGNKAWHAAGRKFAEEGGRNLYSDVRAFNTARDTRHGGQFTGNHIFGHSYGSTTASYAGTGGRLHRVVSTMTLIGSPGAGVLQHASDVGIGADNVYVASSSRDPYTVLGGRTPGSFGRLFGLGLGVDPSMASFGAQRITAEFSAEMDSRRTNLTHNAYYRFVDRTSDPPVRSESLANFGRIAAGRDVDLEPYRRVDERPWYKLGWRTIEPADGRPLRLDDDVTGEHAGDRETRRIWNPRWRAQPSDGDSGGSPHGEPPHGEPPSSDVLSASDFRSSRELADHALRLRVPPVDADQLMNPLGEAELNVGRSQANAKWWAKLSGGRQDGLSDAQKALIETYPFEIGNSEGIPPFARHEANNIRYQDDLTRRDELVARRDNSLPLTSEQNKFIERMNLIEAGMRSSATAAARVGVEGPYLLAYDRDQFDGNGRAIVSFGDDPYKAKSVSWYIPGMGTTIDKLRTIALRAVNQLESVKRQDSNLSACSIAYIGYKAPGFDPRVASPDMAITGGEILHSDITAFNVGRDEFAGDGTHFSGNHIFAHSYGSASFSYAGQGGRLSREVTTVTLIGSPGAGPLQSASEFDIGDNVFVAASSRDEVTSFGSDHEGGRGRAVENVGLGLDPAMDIFGARRITAEFTAEMDFLGKGSITTHSSYWSHMDHRGDVRVRSESLANFGRIAAGQGEQVILEGHRTLVEGANNRLLRAPRRTFDPAVGRPLFLVDDGGRQVATGPRHRWNPGWNPTGGIQTPIGHLDADGNPVGFLNTDGIGNRHDSGESDPVTRALRQRVPPLTPDQLVTPLGSDSTELAATRAQANADWWARLANDPDAQRALIAAHPHQIGNADGIPIDVRDAANHRVLQGLRDRANEYRATRSRDLNSAQRKARREFVKRVDRIDAALTAATAAAERAGVGRPLLMAFDVRAFGGNGRALLAYGGDPYSAQRVSWHTARGSIDDLNACIRPALDRLQANRQDTGSAVAVVSVGHALHSDLAAFRAYRQTTGAGEPAGGNRVYPVRSAGLVERILSGRNAARARTPWVPPEAGSLVVAHRGASHEFPEQTFAAYEEALRQGADALECDVRITKDGRLICIHDKSVDRTSNGTGKVEDMTFAQLQALDYGGWHSSAELGDAQGDTGLLTLDRLLELVTSQDRHVTLFIEIKQRGGTVAREVASLLQSHGLANPTSPDQSRVAVISFYPDAVSAVHRAAPNVPTVQLLPTPLGSIADVVTSASGATAIGPSIQTLRANPELVDLAASQGMATYCWTVNSQHDVQFARDLGVAFIATDHPGRTASWLAGDPTGHAAVGGESVRATSEPDAGVRAPAESDDTATQVQDALAQRIPPVTPEELRNPLGPMEEARARARHNATWWKGLTAGQRDLLIKAYPQHIGNAEGIRPVDRDTANKIVLQQLRDQADEISSRKDGFEPTTRAERRLLKRVTRFQESLDKAMRDARRAGEDPPLLLAFAPAEFGGDGRAVLSFGHDPYDADSVSWHVPGVQSTLRSLFGFNAGCALNHLQSVRRENPDLTAASIAWIGYDAPSGSKLWRMTNQTLARNGGDVLYSDISAFNAGRDTLAADGSRFDGNHVFGYSYGSTTTAYAGRGERLASQVRTITLIGSPGAGPVQRASEFGLDPEKVFVASSSRDMVTALGGRTPGSTSGLLSSIGRMLGLGLGVDPAMDFFGAVRVTAEVSAAMNRPLILGTHHTYYQHTNSADPRTRSEALTNLGRIAAGQDADQLIRERHRTEGDRRGLVRTIEPAGERSVHRFGNPAWLGTDGYRDPEFIRQQEEYRSQDRTSRPVDTRYADPLGDVVDNDGDLAAAGRLADDLSGVYGPYRIQFEPLRFGTEVRLNGVILNGDTEIGRHQWILDRDADGNLVATNSGLEIREEFKHLRGQGFSRALSGQLERYFVRSGVDRIEGRTHDKGGYAWPRQGFTWNPDPVKLQESLNSIKASADTLRPKLSPQARVVLDEMVQRLEPGHPRLPDPIDLANLAAPGEPQLGRRLMEGVGLRHDHGLNLVRYLPTDSQVITSRPRTGFVGRLKRWLGLGVDPDPNCGHDTVAMAAARYGRDFRILIPRSSSGLPAWAVFDAVGSGSQFAQTLDEVHDQLLQLGDRSSAVLALRWADGRHGGHAAFLVNDGGRIFLEERIDGRTVRSAWPPSWAHQASGRMAVGYLDSDGFAVRPLHDVPLQLAAADAIGDVKGQPDDPDFVRQQENYRREDRTLREVNTHYADLLRDVLRDAVEHGSASERVRQFAKDLSGVYGPYRVELEAEVTGGTILVLGAILKGDAPIGLLGRSFYIDRQVPGPEGDGELVVFEDLVGIDDPDLRGKGFSKAVIAQMFAYYGRCGVDRVEFQAALENGGYAWAKDGVTWTDDPVKLKSSLDSVKDAARKLKAQVNPAAKAELDRIIRDLDDPDTVVEPVDLARLKAPGEPKLGRTLMNGTKWWGVMHLGKTT